MFLKVNKNSRTSNVQHEKRVQFYRKARFIKLNSAFIINPIENSWPFFFREFSKFTGRALFVAVETNDSEILLKLQETELIELTKYCYCSNSKGDNFNVKRL